MKNILIIGGTRNIGYYLAQHLLQAGHRVTLLNRGVTSDDLPNDIQRLHADRTDYTQMRRALTGRQFDVVVDMVVYREDEAEMITGILEGQVGHYLMISTGQVYLVRSGIERPYTEDDYDGPLIPQPEPNTYDYEEWLYGKDKREAEDMLYRAHAESGFPVTTLRLPMVNSERDGFQRLYSYMLRLQDGGPLLVPEAPDYPLRHVYAGDIVSAASKLIDSGLGIGRAYNISQDETISLYDFLQLLGDIMGVPVDVRYVPREVLHANGFLPYCSPFSDTWMSELDNSRSKAEFNMQYTPLRTYLERIVSYYQSHPPAHPVSYRRRHAEKELAQQTT